MKKEKPTRAEVSALSDKLGQQLTEMFPHAELYELGAFLVYLGSAYIIAAIPDDASRWKPVAANAMDLLNNQFFQQKLSEMEEKTPQT